MNKEKLFTNYKISVGLPVDTASSFGYLEIFVIPSCKFQE